MRQLTVRIQAKARADLELYTLWYAERSTSAAGKLRREMYAAVSQIRNFPGSAPIVSGKVRRIRLNSFPVGIAYRVEKNSLIIVAITHERQKPGSLNQD